MVLNGFGLLVSTYGNRLIKVSQYEPESTLFVDEYGVQHTGTIVPVVEVGLTLEQLEMGFPMGYDADLDKAILHPVLGPEYQVLLNDAPKAKSDLTLQRSQLKTLAQQALAQFDLDETQRLADIAALQAATSLAQAKPIIANMLAREQLKIKAHSRTIKVVLAAIGVPLGAQNN